MSSRSCGRPAPTTSQASPAAQSRAPLSSKATPRSSLDWASNRSKTPSPVLAPSQLLKERRRRLRRSQRKSSRTAKAPTRSQPLEMSSLTRSCRIFCSQRRSGRSTAVCRKTPTRRSLRRGRCKSKPTLGLGTRARSQSSSTSPAARTRGTRATPTHQAMAVATTAVTVRIASNVKLGRRSQRRRKRPAYSPLPGRRWSRPGENNVPTAKTSPPAAPSWMRGTTRRGSTSVTSRLTWRRRGPRVGPA